MSNGNVVGIDVSKAHLDVGMATGRTRRFANDDAGIASLLEWLSGQEVAQVVYEPTGGYELALAAALGEAGAPCRRVHPNKVRARHPLLDTGTSLWTAGQDRPSGRPGPGPLRRRF